MNKERSGNGCKKSRTSLVRTCCAASASAFASLMRYLYFLMCFFSCFPRTVIWTQDCKIKAENKVYLCLLRSTVLFSLMLYFNHICLWPRCYLLMCFFSCFTPQLFGPIHSRSRTSLACYFHQICLWPRCIINIEIKCCRK